MCIYNSMYVCVYIYIYIYMYKSILYVYTNNVYMFDGQAERRGEHA